MTERNKLYWLTIIMAGGTVLAAGVAIGLLYQAALREETSRLREAVRSQARLIEAFARHQAERAVEDDSEAWKATLLAEVAEAHEQYKSFGATGEFMLGRREGDHLVLLLRHSHDSVSAPGPETAPMPFGGPLAQPMQAALSGQSGTTIGIDYRGAEVLAAYEPVAVVDWGIVAKIELAEVRAPFIRAGLIVLLVALAVAGAGAFVQVRVAHPVIDRLEETEAQAKAILTTAADAIISASEEGIIESFNPAAERIFGYAAVQVVGRELKSLLAPVHHESFDEGFADYLRSAKGGAIGVPHEVLARRKDGETFPAEVTVSEMRLTDRRRFSAIIREVTERKKAEESLLRAKVEWERTFDSVPDLVAILDDQHRILRANKAMADRLGLPPDQCIGKRCYEAVHGLACPPDSCPHVRTLADGQEHMAEVHEERLSSDFLVSTSPLSDPQGRMLGSVHVARDITALKRAEHALRGSREDLNRAQAVAHTGSWRLDVRRNELLWSDENHRMFGVPKGTPLTYEAFLAIVHPEDREYVDRKWKAGLAGEHYDIEHRIIADGRVKWVRETAVLEFDDKGGLLGGFGTTQDITERRRAEEAMKEALIARQAEEAQRLISAYNRSLIEASLDPLVTIDADGKITDVNAATEKVTGCTRQELIGTDFSDYFTEPEKARAGYQQVFRDGSVQDYALEIRHRAGKLTPVVYNASVYRDMVGNVVGVFAAARDITERKRAEEAMKVERQRLYDVLETLPAYVVLLTPDYHVPFANRFFVERFGESHGRRCFEYLFGRREPCEICETYTVMKTKAPHHWEWTGPDGRDYDIFDFPFTDTDGSPLIMEMGIDITERKRLEVELRRLNEELEQRVAARTADLVASNKELEAFAYSVSHDLRAPLRAIDGFSQAVLEDYGDKLDLEARSHLQRVRAASQRMAELIDGMLSLSRITRSQMRRTAVDLSALAQAAALDLQKTAPARRVEFVIAPRLVVKADADLLRVVLENLLGNAWKFTSKRLQARIEVGAMQRDGETVYFVRDDGAGFDMAYARNLFGAFQRLHTAVEFEGTGIGLATVQRIIHRHGGQVWAEGEVDKGAAFYFTLPTEPR
jgi:PAS domain S-box-containing protein